jgi:regulator of replication initiation timing
MHHFAFIVSKSESHTSCVFQQRSTHFKSGLMSSFKFNSQMQALVQTQKMDQLEQEVHELREEVTTLRAEVEKLTNLVSSLTVTKGSPQFQQHTQQQYPRQPYQQQQPRQQASRAIPVKYAVLLPQLLERNLVQTKAPPPVPTRLPAWYRPDLFCTFHQGAPGHDIEHCNAMKNAVQNLVRTNRLTF